MGWGGWGGVGWGGVGWGRVGWGQGLQEGRVTCVDLVDSLSWRRVSTFLPGTLPHILQVDLSSFPAPVQFVDRGVPAGDQCIPARQCTGCRNLHRCQETLGQAVNSTAQTKNLTDYQYAISQLCKRVLSCGVAM